MDYSQKLTSQGDTDDIMVSLEVWENIKIYIAAKYFYAKGTIWITVDMYGTNHG